MPDCMLREILGSRRACSNLAAVRDKCLAPVAHQRYDAARDIAPTWIDISDTTQYVHGPPHRHTS
jgi:hypothetical protein